MTYETLRADPSDGVMTVTLTRMDRPLKRGKDKPTLRPWSWL
jgi:hypothetical protein